MKTYDSKIGDVLKWANIACVSQRAFVNDHEGDDDFVPSWLPELEASLKAVNDHEISGEEIEALSIAHEYLKSRISS